MVEKNESGGGIRGLFGWRTSRKAGPKHEPTAAPETPTGESPAGRDSATAADHTDNPARRSLSDRVRAQKAENAVTEDITPQTIDQDAELDARTGQTGGDQSGTDQRSEPPVQAPRPLTTALLFQAPDLPALPPRPNRRSDRNDFDDFEADFVDERADRSGSNDRNDADRTNRGARDDRDGDGSSVRRRARRRPGDENRAGDNDPKNTVVKVRTPREREAPEQITEPQRIKGSTRLEAKKQRRRDGRDAGRRRPVVTEAEFLARRESVDRSMVIRARDNRIQIGVLEDDVLVEHYVARAQEASLIGNVYLGRVQNVLPSMEAAFVDIGRGRNAVLYSGEVDWEAAAENSSSNNQPRRIELALKPGDKVLVQVTKDPIGHKGARLTSQISLPGRYLVYVPNGSMNGISRKLPDTERARLKKILKEVLPENTGVIVRTAAEGATEEQLTLDVKRLTTQWAEISRQVETQSAPYSLHSEPDLLIKIIRDVFNEDFQKLVISGDDARGTIETYLSQVAPDLLDRVERYEGSTDVFDEYRITEQIEKALDRKVWLPSGGSLVIDRTEAMTVVDVNTGKFVGSGGNLEETVTKNNLEAADEIVRQLRLRDIGGIIVVDFIDMVLETNRDLVLRRLLECLSRDRTKHQVAEVTSLGLVQMTRKKLGLGLLESFSENCEACAGRGIIVQHDPLVKHRQSVQPEMSSSRRRGKGSGDSNRGSSNSGSSTSGTNNGGGNNGNGNGGGATSGGGSVKSTHGITEDARNALAKIATSTIVSALQERAAEDPTVPDLAVEEPVVTPAVPDVPAETSAPVTPPRGSRSRRASSSGGAGTSVTPVADAAPSDGAQGTLPANAASEVPAHVAILDIPVTKAVREPRRVSKQDAEELLGSVLSALPEPKEPGKGRSRSRRVSTATLSAPITPAGDAGHSDDAGTSDATAADRGPDRNDGAGE
nr:Rne/Rng family ribonuclease [Planctomonas psychrotolerans]